MDFWGKTGLIFKKSLKKCEKMHTNNHGFYRFARNMRTNARKYTWQGEKNAQKYRVKIGEKYQHRVCQNRHIFGEPRIFTDFLSISAK